MLEGKHKHACARLRTRPLRGVPPASQSHDRSSRLHGVGWGGGAAKAAWCVGSAYLSMGNSSAHDAPTAGTLVPGTAANCSPALRLSRRREGPNGTPEHAPLAARPPLRSLESASSSPSPKSAVWGRGAPANPGSEDFQPSAQGLEPPHSAPSHTS